MVASGLTVVLLGHTLVEVDPWRQIVDQLYLSDVSVDEFLGALDAAGQKLSGSAVMRRLAAPPELAGSSHCGSGPGAISNRMLCVRWRLPFIRLNRDLRFLLLGRACHAPSRRTDSPPATTRAARRADCAERGRFRDDSAVRPVELEGAVLVQRKGHVVLARRGRWMGRGGASSSPLARKVSAARLHLVATSTAIRNGSCAPAESRPNCRHWPSVSAPVEPVLSALKGSTP